MRGMMIAGTHSGCGKTTVTLGLHSAFQRRGLVVQPFKAGPDFIDSGLHRMITGRPSRNLDLWMCGADYVRDCFGRNMQGADVAVAEGVMGLYDGEHSTATLAVCLGIPVVLVIDAYGMAETAGAVIQGMGAYGSRHGGRSGAPVISGVIFNRVASENHYRRLCNGVRGVKTFGYLPRDLHFEIPHRHLGLATAEESPLARENIALLADAVLKHIDIDLILEQSSPTPPGGGDGFCSAPALRGGDKGEGDAQRVKIAVARDKAFCFYYEDNLDLLRAAGAELVFFSPLADAGIPAGVQGVYIGGGYPELYAGQLSENRSMLGEIKSWSAADRPLYAECGGLMYLSKGIRDFENRFFAMADIFPFETRMKKGRSRLGYRQAELREDCIIGRAGAVVRGHEFHYSEIMQNGELPGLCYALRDGGGEYLHDEGYRRMRTLASYVHIHFGSNPAAAVQFVNSCKTER